MGIGFDLFKARVGYEVAGGVLNSVSNAIDKAAEQRAQANALAKEQSDRNDTLRSLVFMLGNRIALDRDGKKAIARALSRLYDEDISLFSIEDKLDAAYTEIKDMDPKVFFQSIAAINTDRQMTSLIYTYIMYLYGELVEGGFVLPVHVYNMALIKRYFGLNRNEMAECYKAIASLLEKDIDDIADLYEELTSEESIKKIEEENPSIIYVEEKKELPAASSSAEIESKINDIYNQALADSDSDVESFRQHVFIANSNPDCVARVVSSYAESSVGENAVIVFDDTISKNFKDGIFVTNKYVYIGFGGKLESKIPLSEITSITAKTGLLTTQVIINNSNSDSSMLSKKGTLAFCDFLQKIVPLAMQL